MSELTYPVSVSLYFLFLHLLSSLKLTNNFSLNFNFFNIKDETWILLITLGREHRSKYTYAILEFQIIIDIDKIPI